REALRMCSGRGRPWGPRPPVWFATCRWCGAHPPRLPSWHRSPHQSGLQWQCPAWLQSLLRPCLGRRSGLPGNGLPLLGRRCVRGMALVTALAALGVSFRCQLVPLDGSHHIDDALVDMRQLAVGQRALIGRADVLVDHLLAVGLINRQRRGGFELPNRQGGARPLAEQFHKLAIQHIDALSQFFDRHSILVSHSALQRARSAWERELIFKPRRQPMHQIFPVPAAMTDSWSMTLKLVAESRFSIYRASAS